jgi:sulfur carrier protein ThiS
VNGVPVKLNTIGEWKKVLAGTNQNYDAAVANAQSRYKDALSKLGITDPNVIMSLNANRKNLTKNEELNIDLFEDLTGVQVNANNYGDVMDNFKVYNEALTNENNLERTKNNIESKSTLVKINIKGIEYY